MNTISWEKVESNNSILDSQRILHITENLLQTWFQKSYEQEKKIPRESSASMIKYFIECTWKYWIWQLIKKDSFVRIGKFIHCVIWKEIQFLQIE